MEHLYDTVIPWGKTAHITGSYVESEDAVIVQAEVHGDGSIDALSKSARLHGVFYYNGDITSEFMDLRKFPAGCYMIRSPANGGTLRRDTDGFVSAWYKVDIPLHTPYQRYTGD